MPKGKDRTLAVKIGLSVLLVACFCLSTVLIMTNGCLDMVNWLPCQTHLFGQLLHANLFHLLANLSVLWTMRISPRELSVAYLLSVPATFATPTPAIGFSSVLYALMGMKICRVRMKPVEWSMFVLGNAATVFIPAIAFGVHLAAFMMGLVYDYLKRLTDEYRKACKRG